MSFSPYVSSSAPRTSRSSRRSRSGWAGSAATAAWNRRKSSLKISSRESGVSAGASVLTLTPRRTGRPVRERRVTVLPSRVASVSPASPSSSRARWFRPSKLGCSTRTVQTLPRRPLVTTGSSRPRRPAPHDRDPAFPLPHGQALHPADQPDQLGLGKRRRAQGERIVPRIAEVPLHPHRAEEEESDQQGRGGLQPVGHRAPGAGAGHDRTRGAPREGGGPARRIPRGEPHALVGGVGPEVHDPAPPAIEVDLEGVPARVPVHPGLVSLVGGGVVDPRLGKGEVGRNRVRPEDNRRREQEYGEAHTGRIVLP